MSLRLNTPADPMSVTKCDDEVAGVNADMCSGVMSLEMLNESNAGLLQQLAETQAQREEAWSNSRQQNSYHIVNVNLLGPLMAEAVWKETMW